MRRSGGLLLALFALTLAPFIPASAAAGTLELEASVPFDGGTDMDFAGDLVFVGSWNSDEHGGMYIVDISTPTDPQLLSHFRCGGNQNDVGALSKDTVVLAMHRSYGGPGCTDEIGGLRVVDVSDPTAPKESAFVQIEPSGTHTVTIVGDTGYVYANPGGVETPNNWATTIVDVRDPANPKVAGTFTPPGSTGCHDINVVGDRAYCAGSNITQIWDVSDPVDPQVVSSIVNPGIFFHHTAMPSSDGDTLVITDEAFGVHVCDPTGKNPTGAYWFYDITIEQAPILRGWLGNTERLDYGHGLQEEWCTVHNGNMVPGRDWMLASAYYGGTTVIDFSEPSLPTVVSHLAPESADTWSAYYYDGYVYASDLSRGFDVMSMDELLALRKPDGQTVHRPRAARVKGARTEPGPLANTGVGSPLVIGLVALAAACATAFALRPEVRRLRRR